MRTERSYELIESAGAAPIKAWTRGVPIEEEAARQLRNVARLPIIHKWVAAMPDVHWGIGATVGSVIPTVGAVIPAAVGVDIGCGMMAVQTTLTANDLPESLREMRAAIERAVPHGREPGQRDPGAWTHPPAAAQAAWASLAPRFEAIVARHPAVRRSNTLVHLGTLGSGNHFIETCLDEADRVWVMLHSGSRGVGNKIGRYFIELAKKDMRAVVRNLPDQDLAYFSEGTRHFADYVEAVQWAQDFATTNRRLMMDAILAAVARLPGLPPFSAVSAAVNCHHTTTWPASIITGPTCWSRARARYGPASASSASFPAAWARAPTSCAARAIPRASRAAATGPGGRCRGPPPSGASRWRTTPRPRRGWSVARTPG
jgi:tRNA-splicing ligase RtcB